MRNLDLIELVKAKAISKYNLSRYCHKNYNQGWLGDAVYIADTDIIYYNEESRKFGYCYFDGSGSNDECFEIVDYNKGVVIDRLYFSDFEDEIGQWYIY